VEKASCKLSVVVEPETNEARERRGLDNKRRAKMKKTGGTAGGSEQAG
jgi:hypothetical protein